MNDKPLWAWASFFGIILLLLIFDLGLFSRKERDVGIRESLWLSVLYIFIAISFGGFVSRYIGHHQGKDFFTAWLVEKSLSLDNILVISMVFSYFQIPLRYQHRVLFWGVLGVVLLRGVMIGAGAMLIQQFHFVLYLFGLFLIFTGIKMLFVAEEEEESLENNKLLLWLRRWIKVAPVLSGKRFFVQTEFTHGDKPGYMATPLFLVLIFIEFADIVFAVDSIPAVFAITTDPFVVYTSNIFAILGLRSLFFALSAMLHRFAYLKYAVALVLVFIGGKIFASLFGVNISSGLSLAVTVALLLGGVIISLWKTKEHGK